METAKRATQAGRRLARASVPLPFGRPVLPITRDRRQKLKESWVAWLADEGFTWEEIGTWAVGYVGRLNDILSRYGRWLYDYTKMAGHITGFQRLLIWSPLNSLLYGDHFNKPGTSPRHGSATSLLRTIPLFLGKSRQPLFL